MTRKLCFSLGHCLSLAALPLLLSMLLLRPDAARAFPPTQPVAASSKAAAAWRTVSPSAADDITTPLVAADHDANNETDNLPTAAAASAVQTRKCRLEVQRLRQFLFQRYRTTTLGSLLWTVSAVVTYGDLLPLPRRLARNMVAGSLIFAIGDAAAQLLTQRQAQDTYKSARFTLDQPRWATALALGAVWAGVCNPAVYDAVERYGPPNVFIKMAISCSILSTAGNYITMWVRRWAALVLDGSRTGWQHAARAAAQACNADFMEVLRDDLKVWPAYDVLCYSVIPPPVRPITTALMASAWSMYMSWTSAKGGNGSESSGDGSKHKSSSSSSFAIAASEEKQIGITHPVADQSTTEH